MSRLRGCGRASRRVWPALASLITLTACEVGPDYRPPSVALAPFHNAAAVAARDPATPVPLDTWWTAFRDPVLEKLIQRAMVEDLDLAASFARAQQARAAALGAGAQLFPTVDANTRASALSQSLNTPFGRVASALPGFDRDQRLYDVGAVATWEIDVAGGLRRGKEAADAAAQTAQTAQAALAGVRIAVAADVAYAYAQIRRDQARIATVQRQIDVDAHLLALVNQLRQHGLADAR